MHFRVMYTVARYCKLLQSVVEPCRVFEGINNYAETHGIVNCSVQSSSGQFIGIKSN